MCFLSVCSSRHAQLKRRPKKICPKKKGIPGKMRASRGECSVDSSQVAAAPIWDIKKDPIWDITKDPILEAHSNGRMDKKNGQCILWSQNGRKKTVRYVRERSDRIQTSARKDELWNMDENNIKKGHFKNAAEKDGKNGRNKWTNS